MKSSNRLSIIAGMIMSIAVVGCQKESSTSVSTSEAGGTSHAQQQPAENQQAKATELPLPGLILQFPYVVQSDSTYTLAATGQLRRAVVLEFKNADIRTMFAETAQALKDMGYATKAEPAVADKVISQSFFGRGGAYLEARKDVGSRPKDPESSGVIALSWPIKSTEEPTPDI